MIMQGNVMNVVNNGNFQGAYATSVKAYFTEVQAKAITTLTTLIDGINLAADKLKENGTTLDSSSGSKIDSEYITGEQTQEMTTFGEAFDTHKQTIDTTIAGVSDLGSFTKPTAEVGEKVEEAKQSLKDIDQKVMMFSDTDVSGDIEALLSGFNALVSYMEACSGSGSISYTSGDLEKQKFYAGLESKLANMENKGLAPDEVQEKDFYNNLTPEQQSEMNKILNDENTSNDEKQSLFSQYLQNLGQNIVADKILETLQKKGLALYFAEMNEKVIQTAGIKLAEKTALAFGVELTEKGLTIAGGAAVEKVAVSVTDDVVEATVMKASSALSFKMGSKALGAGFGGVVSFGVNVASGDDPAKAATKAAVGTAVQVGVTAGISALPIPFAPYVGYLAGVGASLVTDEIIDRYWDDPIGQASKDLQAVGNVIGTAANNMGNAIASVIPPMLKWGW